MFKITSTPSEQDVLKKKEPKKKKKDGKKSPFGTTSFEEGEHQGWVGSHAIQAAAAGAGSLLSCTSAAWFSFCW
jgi:hypothetical protein